MDAKTPWPADRVERRPIAGLAPNARNARTHSPAQVAQLAASMKEWGWTNPVLVDEGGAIIAGHGRVLAAVELGFTEVPVMVAEGWSEAQKRAYALADNQLALNAGWDMDTLADELRGLKEWDFDLSLLGFRDLDALLARGVGFTDPDEVPPVPASAISRMGDLWQLGEHRLLCGDSTNAENVQRLMNGRRAALFSTDPPYAVNYTGGVHVATRANRANAKRDKNWSEIYQEADRSSGDTEIGEEFYDKFVECAVANAIKHNAAWYCWHASVRSHMLEDVWNRHGAFAHQQIIWVKSRPVLTHSAYMWHHEPCLMGWLRGNKPPLFRTSPELLKTTVWEVPNSEAESKDHPTCKPIRLFTTPMLLHTKSGGLCYEPFSGSGSQIMAAETLGRRCYAIEITPAFVDVAVRRWELFTGSHATLDDDGRAFDEVVADRAALAA